MPVEYGGYLPDDRRGPPGGPPSGPSGGLRRRQVATRLVFLVVGFALAAWGPLVPFARARAGLSSGGLGLLLLCLGLGSVVGMPLAARLLARVGCRRVLLVACALLCLMLPGLALASTAATLAACLLLFGAAMGAMDCVINVQAVAVEHESARPMMSGFHGMFSVGTLLGAAGASGGLGLGLSPAAISAAVVACVGGTTALAAGGLLGPQDAISPPPRQAGARRLVLPHGVVLLAGAMCCVAFLVEGAVLDWSAVFLSTARHLPPARAGAGYVAFCAMMVAGRLSGDAIVRRMGDAWVIGMGAACAATGLALVVMVAAPWVAFGGLALMGAGCANIVPVLYGAMGRQRVMPVAAAVSGVTIMGYAGILIGPALIGMVAQYSSLSVAFMMLAALLALVGMGARAVTGPRARGS
ncbi:MFS transporter [Gluconacetobacter entanii]|uniref:MFS transporter n=1 Tax=Gluconacetobacter entanii TaxID=108528 RepID=A0ABT3K5K5_9PROT|nr:MFS transporter [Gluconacetobacter entanii]MCW4590701.1 MFS transporter [Gluconacetobacter entanii]NPC89065.1 MFS transporter [Gluconacetobacter entanii]